MEIDAYFTEFSKELSRYQRKHNNDNARE